MVSVFHDECTVQTVVTNDKVIHMMWPGFVEEEVSPFGFYKTSVGTVDVLYGWVKFATADNGVYVLEVGQQVLYHHPFNPLNIGQVRFLNKIDKTAHAVGKQALYYRDDKDLDSDGRPYLKPLRFVKFPKTFYDQDSDGLILIYWTNVPADELKTILDDFAVLEAAGTDTTNDERNYTIITKAAEPFQDTGAVDSTLQRVMAYTKATVANLYDDQLGYVRYQPSTLIFDRPRLLLKPGAFDVNNTAEPVLDIHTGAGGIFLEFLPIP